MPENLEIPENPGAEPKTRSRKAPLREAVEAAKLSRKKKDLIYTTTEPRKKKTKEPSEGKRYSIWCNKDEKVELEKLQSLRLDPKTGKKRKPSDMFKEAVHFNLLHIDFETKKADEIAREMELHGIPAAAILKAMEKKE